MKNKRISKLLLGIILFTFLASFCAKTDYTNLYYNAAYHPSLNEDDIIALKHLGSKIIENGVNFNLYSKNGTRAEILIFDDPDSSKPTRYFEMSKLNKTVFTIYIEGIGKGT